MSRSSKILKRKLRKKLKLDKRERSIKRKLGGPVKRGTKLARVGNRVVRHSPALAQAITATPAPPLPLGGVIAVAAPEEIADIMAAVPAPAKREGKIQYGRDGSAYRVYIGGEYAGWVAKVGKVWQASEDSQTYWGEYAKRELAAEALR